MLPTLANRALALNPTGCMCAGRCHATTHKVGFRVSETQWTDWVAVHIYMRHNQINRRITDCRATKKSVARSPSLTSRPTGLYRVLATPSDDGRIGGAGRRGGGRAAPLPLSIHWLATAPVCDDKVLLRLRFLLTALVLGPLHVAASHQPLTIVSVIVGRLQLLL